MVLCFVNTEEVAQLMRWQEAGTVEQTLLVFWAISRTNVFTTAERAAHQCIANDAAQQYSTVYHPTTGQVSAHSSSR